MSENGTSCSPTFSSHDSTVPDMTLCSQTMEPIVAYRLMLLVAIHRLSGDGRRSSSRQRSVRMEANKSLSAGRQISAAVHAGKRCVIIYVTVHAQPDIVSGFTPETRR